MAGKEKVGTLDYRFWLCIDSLRVFTLINTGLQPGDERPCEPQEPFQRFPCVCKTRTCGQSPEFRENNE